MDRFFKMFSKGQSNSNNKKEENKAKEEEDLLFQTTLNFDVIQLKPNDLLNNLVKDIKIGGVLMENYEHFNSALDKLLDQFNEDIDELDYRFSKICDKIEIMPSIDATKIEKMKLVGKIGESQTVLDESSLQGELLYSYNKLRIQSKQGFASIRTNNCVFKRKWVYEIQIVSNNLQQIGWCQINTPFTNTDGVGDDISSYSYDGYRIVLWHAGKKDYGLMWDVGDVIGCCIDLDSRQLEYFVNGVSMGIASKDVPIGENIAYFPAVSMSQEEKAIFNFGQSPFRHSYPNYEAYDLPESIFNGSVEIIAELIDLLKNSLMKTLISKSDKITPYHKISLTNKLFNFFIQISFKDIFIFKTLIIPYLYETSANRPNELVVFFEHLFIYMSNNIEKVQFVSFLFDNLCGMIEETAISGSNTIDEWKNLITLLIELVKIDFIVELWIESGKTVDNLKLIFNSNLLKMRDIHEYLMNKFSKFNTDITAYKAFKEIKNEFYGMFLSSSEKNEKIYSENLKNILILFLTDKRTFKAKTQSTLENEKVTLKSILIECVNKGNEFFNVANHNLLEALGQNNNKKDHTPFHKNFIFNLYSILSDYMFQDLKSFSTSLWFKRLSPKNLFYDEVGIGGTINHVTTEFISHIHEHYKDGSQETFESEINHRIVKITSVLIIQLRETTKILEKFKSVSLKQIVKFDNGTDYFNKLFRNYFYLFTEQNQILLYKYAFFLIKWINFLIRSNKYLVYFMPKCIYDIPFDIYRFLHKIKSNVLYNNDIRLDVNKSSPHFLKDDFTFEIIYFYTYLFGDQVIANPDIKESLILKMKYFMKKKEVSRIYEENSEIIEYLIKGLLHYMSIESLCHIACEIMVKLIKPMCFGHQNGNIEIGKLVKVTKKFFETNVKTFHEFMDNYMKLINKVMTEYTITLNESASKILSGGNNSGDIMDTKTTLLKKLTFSYSLLCDLMKIFEFLLTAYPNEFFDISTLNYSRFTNFLKNTSSRILEKTYITQLIKLLEKTKPGNNFPGGVDAVLLMAYSIIGIFLNIESNKENPKFQEFINKIVNLSDLDMDPFIELYKTVKGLNTDNKLNEGIEKYKGVIEFFMANTNKKRERTMSTEEWEETNKNENICIICYTNTSDRILIPCKHVCCNECLMQYLSEKQYCFICNTHIEKAEVFIPKI